MTEAKGTKNTKEMLDLMLAGYDFGRSALADGKLGLGDIFEARKLVPVVGPAIADAAEVIPELKDLSVEEGAELVSYAAARLSVDSPKAKLIVEAALKALAANYALYKAISAPAAA